MNTAQWSIGRTFTVNSHWNKVQNTLLRHNTTTTVMQKAQYQVITVQVPTVLLPVCMYAVVLPDRVSKKCPFCLVNSLGKLTLWQFLAYNICRLSAVITSRITRRTFTPPWYWNLVEMRILVCWKNRMQESTHKSFTAYAKKVPFKVTF